MGPTTWHDLAGKITDIDDSIEILTISGRDDRNTSSSPLGQETFSTAIHLVRPGQLQIRAQAASGVMVLGTLYLGADPHGPLEGIRESSPVAYYDDQAQPGILGGPGVVDLAVDLAGRRALGFHIMAGGTYTTDLLENTDMPAIDQIRKVSAAIKADTLERDRLIVAARDEKATWEELATAVGLSRQTVIQIWKNSS
ncbi:MAG: hypothetical protein L0G87_00510 [Renibacterium salmoninarum]|nr:hypothetical protein [Renibacterium salmoninarum]